MVHVFLLWLHICSCIVFCCLISLIPVLSPSLLKQLLLSYSSDLVGGRTLQTENAVQRWLPFLTTQMWVPLHTWCMVSFFLLKGNENWTELSEENTNSYGVIMTLYLFYFTMQVLLYALKFWLSFQLLPPRQVWTTNIPPKCLPIWHCVSVDPGGGQRLEACHHHQTGLNTSFSTASLLYSYQQWRWLFFFHVNWFTIRLFAVMA